MNTTPFQNPGPYHNTDIGGDIYSRTGGHEGGWPSKEAAMAGIAEDQRIGTVIAIREGYEVTEWWWQGGTTLAHLVLYTKEPDFSLSVKDYSPGVYYEIGDYIRVGFLLFKVSYQSFIGESDVFAEEYNKSFGGITLVSEKVDMPDTWVLSNGSANLWRTPSTYIKNWLRMVEVNIDYNYNVVAINLLQSEAFYLLSVRYFITIPANTHVRFVFDPNHYIGDIPDPDKDWHSTQEQVLDLQFLFDGSIYTVTDNRKGIASAAEIREHFCQLDFTSDALMTEVAFDAKMSFTEFKEVENATLNRFHLRLLPNELSPTYTTIAELNSAINTLYPSNPGTYFVRVVINPLANGATTACAVLRGIETA